MIDRLKNILQQEIKELHKVLGFTQVMIMELKDLLPEQSKKEQMTEDKKLQKAQELTEQYEELRLQFDENFDKAFKITTYHKEFMVNSLGIMFYLSVLIGVSAFIGWLIELLFQY